MRIEARAEPKGEEPRGATCHGVHIKHLRLVCTIDFATA